MKRHHWAWRTDKEFPTVLFAELASGRLRQGWGYDPSQDLRCIQKLKAAGGDWWNRLTEIQKETMPHYRILGDGEDSVQLGDIVLVPNLPEYGRFSLVEIVGNYSFAVLEETKDHGHIRPAKLLTERGVNPYNTTVHATLRATLRTPMRMWNLDGYADHIDSILEALGKGADLLTEVQAGERLDHAWRSSLLRALADQLARSFKAAEWEYPVVRALSLLYPGAEVKWTAGPNERGADAVIVIPNQFGGSGGDWLIVVQVKNYAGEIASGALGQIGEAFQKYKAEGQVIGGVLASTADVAAADFDKARQALEEQYRIPVRLLLRQELMDLLMEGFLAAPSGPRTSR